MNEMAGAYLSEDFSSVMLGSVCVGLFLVGPNLDRVWKRAVCCAQFVKNFSGMLLSVDW
jgi:hypothetical protein